MFISSKKLKNLTGKKVLIYMSIYSRGNTNLEKYFIFFERIEKILINHTMNREAFSIKFQFFSSENSIPTPYVWYLIFLARLDKS